jgi:hypothetical protein
MEESIRIFIKCQGSREKAISLLREQFTFNFTKANDGGSYRSEKVELTFIEFSLQLLLFLN